MERAKEHADESGERNARLANVEENQVQIGRPFGHKWRDSLLTEFSAHLVDWNWSVFRACASTSDFSIRVRLAAIGGGGRSGAWPIQHADLEPQTLKG